MLDVIYVIGVILQWHLYVELSMYIINKISTMSPLTLTLTLSVSSFFLFFLSLYNCSAISTNAGFFIKLVTSDLNLYQMRAFRWSTLKVRIWSQPFLLKLAINVAQSSAPFLFDFWYFFILVMYRSSLLASNFAFSVQLFYILATFSFWISPNTAATFLLIWSCSFFRRVEHNAMC